jgi:cell division septation protein DedD
MSRPQRSITHATEEDQAVQPEKRHRFELSTARLVAYCFGLVACLSWMFVLGLLVGRGVPFVGSMDFSPRAELMRFIGLGRQAAEPPRNVAETWEDPKEILQSLRYYEDLTKKGGGPPFSLAKPAPQPKDSAPKGQAADPPPQPQPATNPPPSPPARADLPPAQTAPTAQKPTLDSLKEQGRSEPPGERFTLLISSLRDIENAHRLLEQLRSKGYSPRLDSLDLSESGRWNRVIMGSFPSREEAQRFAADFNRKERMEAMVIRETD